MKRQEFLALLNAWLKPQNFRDVGENGLQVEGCDEIKRVLCGVTANLEFIEHAVEQKADAVFVHHGIVWGGGIRQLTGWLGKRVRTLFEHDINLFAYHLPLDAHPTLGNNAGLADAIGLSKTHEPFGMFKGQAVGLKGHIEGGAVSFSEIVERVTKNVGKPMYVFGDADKKIESVGLCTGGAPDRIYEAIDEGLDLYITGEVTEYVKSVSDESGVAFIGAGHHQSERFGAQRVAKALAKEGFEASFLDVENPA